MAVVLLSALGLCGFSGPFNRHPIDSYRATVSRLQEVSSRLPAGTRDERTRDEQPLATECLLLPCSPYPGESSLTPGEVMLQELEDDQETRTQLFLNADGTVSHGATDGPPPAGFCGLWQCGSEQFQMTIGRSFSTSAAMLERGQVGQMQEDIVYSVTRVYEGVVEVESPEGVGAIQGRIDMVREEDAAAWAASGATSIQAFDPLSNVKTPPIGYFVSRRKTNPAVPHTLSLSSLMRSRRTESRTGPGYQYHQRPHVGSVSYSGNVGSPARERLLRALVHHHKKIIHY